MKLWTVARFTLLRLRRTRYLSAGVLLTLLVFWMVPDGEKIRGLRDLDWAYTLATYLAWFFAIWLGNSMIAADRADGNLRSTLTRPISGIEYIGGKVLGGCVAVTILVAAFTAALIVGVLVEGIEFRGAMLWYPLSLLPIHYMVVALAVALSQWLPRFWALALTLIARDGLFSEQALARLGDFLGDTTLSVLEPLARVLYWLAPATSRVTIGFYDFFYTDKDISLYLIFLPYSLHYVVVACLLAAWHLNREEL
ncbi:MAG: ABC transporter permease subunit [Candidatus Lernaella stagnicola]|nr:ABC transporter permease subunit [Candidatus Lernaella stagnicola]